MGFVPICLLCLASVLGTLANERDLHGRSFVFMKGSGNMVEVRAQPNQPLNSFTLCMWIQSDYCKRYTLFSYAAKGGDKAIHLSMKAPHQYSLHVGSQNVSFGVKQSRESTFGPLHLCASWESDSGIATLWENGKPFPRQMVSKNDQIERAESITLGIPPNTGTSDKPFQGELWNVYMWNHVLSPEDICLVMQGQPAHTPIINWGELWYTIKGNVAVKTTLPLACQILLPWEKCQGY